MPHDPRRLPADTTEIGYTTADGRQRTLRAKVREGSDGYAYVEPTTPEDLAVLDGFGYPVARKTSAESSSKAPKRNAKKTQQPVAAAPDKTATAATTAPDKTADTTADTRGPGAPDESKE